MNSVSPAILVIISVMALSSNAQFGGSLSSNPRGGYDGTVHYGQGIGTPNHNLGGSVFGSKNSNGGAPTYGAGVNYNK